MPISDKYKLIFIHIPRTGGTAFEDTLGLRVYHRQSLYGLIPGKNVVYQHLVPGKLREYIPQYKWNTYYKCVIIRHPLERAISDYAFFVKNDKCALLDIPTFLDYCKLAENVVSQNRYDENKFYDHFRPQYKYIQGIKYDKICRMETYAQDIAEVKKAIGCTEPLRHGNAGIQKVIPTLEEKKIIQHVYRLDFELFGYKMD